MSKEKQFNRKILFSMNSGRGKLLWLKDLGDGRFIISSNGQESIHGPLSRSEYKTAFALEANVAQFFKIHPIEKIGFLTNTFPPEVRTPNAASERFNSFNSHFLRKIAIDYIKVTEPHKDQRPHHHLLVALPYDIQTGFNWTAYEGAQKEFRENGRTRTFKNLRKEYSLSATPELRMLWKSLRKAAHAYGIGRTEILPIRSKAEAAIKYIGKYIEKGVVNRTGPWKGVRLVSYSRGFDRSANCRFAWLEKGQKWRSYVRDVAQLLLVRDLDGLIRLLGTKWAYWIMQCLLLELSPEQAVVILTTGKFHGSALNLTGP